MRWTSVWRRELAVIVLGFVVLFAMLRWESQQIFFDQSAYFYELPAGSPVPEFKLSVELADSESAFVQLETKNFSLAKSCFNPDGELAVGHVHVYLDNKKLASIYGNVGLIRVPPGEHTITASLHVLPGHQALLVDGHSVSDEVHITVPPLAENQSPDYVVQAKN